MSVFSLFTHVFPVPQYVTLSSVGIDISENSLKYIRFTRKHARDTDLTLSAWGELSIPEGTLTGGKVEKPDALVAVLKEARLRTGTRYARVSLPEERAYIFETSIKKGTSPKEIRGLLEFKLEENVPLSPRDAFFGYEILKGNEDAEMLEVVVIVYARETVLAYYDAFVRAGFLPISFEVEASAIARAVVPTTENRSTMIVDFGKHRLGVGIVHDQVLMYTSTIDIGGNELSAAMRGVLGDVAEDELTRLKNTNGLLDMYADPAVKNALTRVVSRMCMELSTRVYYWNTRNVANDHRELTNVVLCGGSSNLVGLPEYLSKELSLPVKRAEVWQNAFALNSYIPPLEKRYAYGYATAVGLALADHIQTSYD